MKPRTHSDEKPYGIPVRWIRPRNKQGKPYKWGDDIGTDDDDWNLSNVIYRWVRSSDKAVAVIGETGTLLRKRVAQYKTARCDGKAGATNKKTYNENQGLGKAAYLFLEFVESVEGFHLDHKGQRRAAEGLLQAFYRPYVQFELLTPNEDPS